MKYTYNTREDNKHESIYMQQEYICVYCPSTLHNMGAHLGSYN